MDTIEKLASLLESNSRAPAGPSGPAGSREKAGPDLIERAVSEGGERYRFPEAGRSAASPAGAGLAPHASAEGETVTRASVPPRSARTVKLDLAWLRKQGIVTPGTERTPTAEGFRRVKRRVLSNLVNAPPNVPANLILVTSALSGEGKTFCAVNLAISIALEVDHSVLLVDADVRRPSVPSTLGLRADRGLMDLLLDRRIDMTDVLCRTDVGKLSLLFAGTAHQHSTELLASGATRGLLREMANRYHDRVIIFDSPPLLAASEATVLASQVGQVVMVVESGKTAESALKEALGRIEPNKLSGLVLNKASDAGLGYGYDAYS